MANAILKVSVDGGKSYEDNLTTGIIAGEQLKLCYQITFNDDKLMTIVFPIYDLGASDPINKEDAFLNNTDWNNIKPAKIGTTQATINASGSRAGVFTIASKGDASIEFKLTSTETVTFKETATPEIYLGIKGVSKPSSIKIPIRKDLKNPAINTFAADRAVLFHGSKTDLNWKIIDALPDTDKLKLSEIIFEKIDDNIVKTKKELVGIEIDKESYQITPPLNISSYSLEVIREGKMVAERELTIYVQDKTSIGSRTQVFEDSKLTNLFTYKDKMYALALNDKTKVVQMWETFDGVNWQKSFNESKFITFSLTQMNKPVPHHFASSPCVVYDNKLYLIGGSKFNPEMLSNEVYFYDFTDNDALGWQKLEQKAGEKLEQKAGKEWFSPRMGHTCIVGTDKQLWLLGGYNESGALKDIWKFDGQKWNNSPNFYLPSVRCMASVIYHNSQLQLFGGFKDAPGWEVATKADSYYFDANSWKTLTITPKAGVSPYTISKVGSVGKYRIIFSAEFSKCQILNTNNELDDIDVTSVQDIFDRESSYYDIQIVEFKGALWLCVLSENETTNSRDLRYFISANN